MASEIEQGESSFKKVLNSKWTVWVAVAVAVALLCVTATVTFALRRDTPKPAGYSPVGQLEQRYGLADIQVSGSSGLGVGTATGTSAAVDAGVQGASDGAAAQATTQVMQQPAQQSTGAQVQTGTKVGPAPTANEMAPLQPVTGHQGTSQVNTQAGAGLQGGGVSAEVVTGVLNGSVQLGL